MIIWCTSNLSITEYPNPVFVCSCPSCICLKLSVHLPKIVPVLGTKKPSYVLLLLVGLIYIHTYMYLYNIYLRRPAPSPAFTLAAS